MFVTKKKIKIDIQELVSDDFVVDSFKSLITHYKNKNVKSGNVIYGDNFFLFYSINLDCKRLLKLLNKSKDVIISLKFAADGSIVPSFFERGLNFEIMPIKRKIGEKNGNKK